MNEWVSVVLNGGYVLCICTLVLLSRLVLFCSCPLRGSAKGLATYVGGLSWILLAMEFGFEFECSMMK